MAKILLNGKILREEDAHIPVLDWGVLYGFGLFESMRAYGGKVFRLDKHLERLYGSARALGVKLGVNREVMDEHVCSVLNANNLSDAYVRLTVTYGASEPRLAFDRKATPNFFAIARPLPRDTTRLQSKGVSLTVSAKYIREKSSPLTYLKSTNYLVNALAKREACDEGVFDVLMLNAEGFVAETSTTNIFIVKGDILETPSVSSGILPGITRAAVLEIAEKTGLSPLEGDVTVEDFIGAEEVFLTNSTLELLPVVKLDEKKIGDGRPGKKTKKLLREYRRLVFEETE